jgi:hypothetical protein
MTVMGHGITKAESGKRKDGLEGDGPDDAWRIGKEDKVKNRDRRRKRKRDWRMDR